MKRYSSGPYGAIALPAYSPVGPPRRAAPGQPGPTAVAWLLGGRCRAPRGAGSFPYECKDDFEEVETFSPQKTIQSPGILDKILQH